MKHFFSSAYFSFLCLLSLSGQATFFNVYDSEFGSDNTIRQVYPLSDGTYILNNWIDKEFFSLIKTDEQGKEILEAKYGKLGNYTVNTINYFIERPGGGGIIFACGLKGQTGNAYFISFSVNDQLEYQEIIDTSKFGQWDMLYLDRFILKHNSQFIFESIGTIHLLHGPVKSNVYVSFDSNGNIIRVEDIAGEHPVEEINELLYRADTKYYYAFTASDVYLIDSSYNFINAVRPVYVLQIGNVRHWQGLPFTRCVNLEEEIVCYSRAGYGNGVSLGATRLVYLKPTADTLLVARTYPVFDDTEQTLYLTDIDLDKEGDFILSCIEGYRTGPNKIHLHKLDTSRNKIWYLEFAGGDAYFPWQVIVDDNNDLLIGGEIFDYQPQSDLDGFLLKVFENGTVSTIWKGEPQVNFRLFPNPAHEYLHIDLPAQMQSYDIHITDMSGRHLKQYTGRGAKSLDVSYLSSGIYIIRIEKHGKIFARQRFVKM